MFFLSNLLTPELFCLHVMSLFNLICSLFFVGGFMTYCLVFFFPLLVGSYNISRHLHANMKSWTRSQTQVPLMLKCTYICIFLCFLWWYSGYLRCNAQIHWWWKTNNQHSIHWNYKHAYLLFVFVSTFEF